MQVGVSRPSAAPEPPTGGGSGGSGGGGDRASSGSATLGAVFENPRMEARGFSRLIDNIEFGQSIVFSVQLAVSWIMIYQVLATLNWHRGHTGGLAFFHQFVLFKSLSPFLDALIKLFLMLETTRERGEIGRSSPLRRAHQTR